MSRGRILALLRDAQRAGAAGHRARACRSAPSSTAPSSPSRCSAIRASARCWCRPCMPATTAWCSASPSVSIVAVSLAVLLIDLLYPLLDPRVKAALMHGTILRDLLRYNREFAAGVVLLSLIVAVRGAVVLLALSAATTSTSCRPTCRRRGPISFGTTSRGQDVFWQLTFAIRNTLLFGFVGRADQPHALAGDRPGRGLQGRLRRPRADVDQRHLHRHPAVSDPGAVLLRDARPHVVGAAGAGDGVPRLGLRRAPDPLGRAQPADPRVHRDRRLLRHEHAPDPGARSTCPTCCRSCSRPR